MQLLATDELTLKAANLDLSGDQYMHSAVERSLIAAHRGHYDDYLRQRRGRKAAGRAGKGFDGVDLGMDPWAGMGAGEPKLSTRAEPLWLADSNLPAKCTPFKGFAAEVAAAMAPHSVRSSGCQTLRVTGWCPELQARSQGA